jgi:hypothetical protein
MAYSPIAFIAPNYSDYGTYWLKAYLPGSTTPKLLAIELTAATTFAKLQLNVDGFFKSAGGALITPYVEGAYDAYLFQTEAEADANNTAGAVRLADNIIPLTDALLRSDLAAGTVDVNVNNDLSQAYTFKTVALMKASAIVFPVGKKIFWQGYYSVSDGGSNWGIVASGTHTDDGGSVLTLADGKYVDANLKGNRVNVKKFGAKEGDQAGFATQIQAWSDYCFANSIGGSGQGTYYVQNTVYMNMNTFKSDGVMIIEPTTGFFVDTPLDFDDMSRRVIVLNKTNGSFYNLLARNGNGVANLIGMDYAFPQITSFRCGSIAFRVNNLVRNYSISIYSGKGINGGTTGSGLIAYAPDFNNEINTLSIHAGDWYQNGAGAIDIGDRNGLFTTVLTSTEQMGNGISITGMPACDQGTMYIDSVINVDVNAYFENDGSIPSAVVVGGRSDGSVKNIEITTIANGFDYHVKCESAVQGINMHNTHSRAITTCALYMTSDIYGYKYEQNTKVGSFSAGQEVHTGVRGGSFYQFSGEKTIDIYELVNGASSGAGSTNHIYKGRKTDEIKTTKNYMSVSTSSSYGRQFVPSSGATKTGTVSSSTISFALQSDVQVFNGGDSVSVGGTVGQVKSVNYDAKTMQMITASYPQGSQSISQVELVPTLSGISSSTPTRTDGANGSLINSSTAGQIGWVYQGGAWISF